MRAGNPWSWLDLTKALERDQEDDTGTRSSGVVVSGLEAVCRGVFTVRAARVEIVRASARPIGQG